jgi:hypothetical protein
LRAEVAPQDEAQIELSGFIGNDVVDWGRLFSGFSLVHVSTRAIKFLRV